MLGGFSFGVENIQLLSQTVGFGGIVRQHEPNALSGVVQTAGGVEPGPKPVSKGVGINVGWIEAGSRLNLNAIPGESALVLELVAFSQEVFDFLYESSVRIINGAAAMYGCTAEIKLNESAIPVKGVCCNDEISCIVAEAAKEVAEVDEIIPAGSLRGAGEDASLFIRKAQDNGGYGTYIMFGTDLSNNAHTPYYDVDERTLAIATETMTRAIAKVMAKSP